MNNYKVIKYFDMDGKKLEDVLLEYFNIYLDMVNDD